MTIRELAELVGVTPRQIRYLIAEEFIPPPTGGRAHARYGSKHVSAIERYKRLRRLGFTPASIRVLLDAREGAPFPVVPGVTLIVDPDLVASGIEPEPLLERIADLLPEILGKEGGSK